MKSFLSILAIALCLTGCVVSQGSRTAESETSDVAPDILIAFGDARCGPCRRNKPTLESWDASGRYEVIFLDGWMGTISVPLYIVVRDGRAVFQTNDISQL